MQLLPVNRSALVAGSIVTALGAGAIGNAIEMAVNRAQFAKKKKVIKALRIAASVVPGVLALILAGCYLKNAQGSNGQKGTSALSAASPGGSAVGLGSSLATSAKSHSSPAAAVTPEDIRNGRVREVRLTAKRTDSKPGEPDIYYFLDYPSGIIQTVRHFVSLGSWISRPTDCEFPNPRNPREKEFYEVLSKKIKISLEKIGVSDFKNAFDAGLLSFFLTGQKQRFFVLRYPRENPEYYVMLPLIYDFPDAATEGGVQCGFFNLRNLAQS